MLICAFSQHVAPGLVTIRSCPALGVERGAFTHSIAILVMIDRLVFAARSHSCNAERCISHGNSVCPSVCLSHAGIVPRRMKMGSCGLRHEVAKTLYFSDTNNVGGRRPLPPKISS